MLGWAGSPAHAVSISMGNKLPILRGGSNPSPNADRTPLQEELAFSLAFVPWLVYTSRIVRPKER